METLLIWLKKGSVARQIGVAVFLIFLMMMTVNTYVIWQKTQAAMQQQVTEQVLQINQMYFDSLNTLMLAGTMDQRETLRQKLLQNDNIIDARVIRGQAVTQQFGSGFASEQARDTIDHQALQGMQSIQVTQAGTQRVLSVAIPYRATSSSHGINCLQCHNVPENTINGAIRIDYSLANTDALIEDNLWQIFIINSLVLCLGIALLAIYMHRNLTHGIREADIVAEAIAQNNFNIPIPAVRKDNLGRLMFSLIKMREALIQQFEDIKTNAENERQIMANQLQQQEKESNLVVAFEAGIVNIVKSLKHTSQAVGSSTAILSHISTDLNQSTVNVSSGTDTVFSQVSETSQSTHDINQSFQEVNQRSQDAIHISKQAMHDASTTSQRMQTLQVASDNIGSVIATITEIAEKTNLLALNASIEAARAGDVGRGFAVVASEVKSLANQTSQATKVIAQQIDEVQSECQGAIAAIHGISSVIEHMNEHTLHIAEIMQQYTHTLEELDLNADAAKQGMQSVRQAVNAVHQAAEQSDTISTEVAQHCAQLQNIALEQEQLVEQFLSMLQNIRNQESTEPEIDDDTLF